MFLVIVCATIAAAVLVYMVVVSRAKSGANVRRHPRVDVSVPVHIHTDDNRHVAESQNISHGGMLLNTHAPVSIAQPISLKFTLPHEVPVEIPAVVSHKKGKQIGVRFDPTHHRRLTIEKWIQEEVKAQAVPVPPKLEPAAPRPKEDAANVH